MRYLIEVDNTKTEKYLNDFLQDNGIEVVDRYEPLERLSAEVGKLGNALREVKRTPGSWNVLNYYLRGRGVSQSTIDAVLAPVKDFFKNVGIDIDAKK